MKKLAIAPLLCLAAAGCDDIANALGGDCTSFESTYQTELQQAGELATSIPAGPEGFAMGLVLNQRAVNELFRRLGDTQLPVLSQSVRILGQQVTVAIRPSIPTLAIGGNQRCVDCFSASVPFSLGVGLGADPPALGSGTLAAQLPLGMIPDSDDRTALVASFQALEVTGLDLDVGNPTFATAVDAIEPVVNTLLTRWLQTRFENARIATFDSWALGQGAVKLAGRGPFVHPSTETIVVAMQSNLPSSLAQSLDVQTSLPAGADIGFVFHPDLLLAMTRRMHYEGVIPQQYDDAGQSFDDGPGGTKVSFNTMRSTDDGLLRTGATLYRTSNACGTADLTAAMGLTVQPGVFAFTVRDVQILSGEGFGRLLSEEAWGTGALVDSLLSTLDFTVNYDQIFGGEAGDQPEMGAFQASIDARGISVYLNIADL